MAAIERTNRPENTILDDGKIIAKYTPMYKVLLHNDDVNTMDHVVKALQEVFKFGHQQSVSLMLEAHKTGLALCRIEPLETAEFHQERLQSFSLTATIEPD